MINAPSRISIESLDRLKTFFEITGIVLVLLTFVAAAGAWLFTKWYGVAKEQQLRSELEEKDIRIAE